LSPSERIAELLSGYPDQLSEGELAELRLAAEQDSELDATLDAIHEVEFLLAADEESIAAAAEPQQLSNAGEQRLATAMSNARFLAVGAVTDKVAVDPVGAEVVPLSGQRSPSQWVGWTALAAGLLLAAGTVVLSRMEAPPTPLNPLSAAPGAADFSMKGEPGAVSGDLMIRGTGAARWIGGEPRSLQHAVRFYAVVPQPSFLAILEVQAANTVVLYPGPGQQWQVAAGTHLLQPEGASAEYQPARAGPATYVLVGSGASLAVPAAGVVPSVEALLVGNPGARELGRVEVQWIAGD
jgi:hypothetical protein